MACEICGKEATCEAEVEGTILKVCSACAKFGKMISTPKAQFKQNAPKIKLQPEEIETVIEDFSTKIKAEREKRAMTVKDFAILLQEKESLVHHMETGHYVPQLEEARKIEKTLKIKLTRKLKDEIVEKPGKKTEGLTIGDLIALKK